MSRRGAQWLAAFSGEAGEFYKAIRPFRLRGKLGVFFCEVAVVLWLYHATVVGFGIAALQNPVAPQRWQALFGCA